MGQPDQCPSKGKFEKTPRKFALETVGAAPTGKAYWRSLDDLADTPEFRDWLEREFPAGASELLEGSRRSFLKLMGASVALAGAAAIPGCRRPDHKIMPYSREVPEEVIPGKALYYATSMAFPGGVVEGLLVETHENRPTKIEGNPLHPVNMGRTSAWAQAAVLDVYDPDRLKDPTFRDETPRSWEDFAAWSKQHFETYNQNRGEGLAFIVDRKPSPTLKAMRRRVLERWPKARWVWYDATEVDEVRRGSEIAFGAPRHELLHLSKAKVIVSLDRDFLGNEPRGVAHHREFAATRRVMCVHDEMSRVYAVESYLSATGGMADHRLRLAPSQVSAFARALYRRVMAITGKGAAAAGASEVPAEWNDWLDAITEDLESHLGASLIVAGKSQPAAVHAMVHAMNEALGNVGTTVTYAEMDEDDAASSAAALADLCGAMRSGAVTTLVTLGANPVYNAPADLGFAEAFKGVATKITLSLDPNETVAASDWRLGAAHALESWGDTRTADGVVAPVQPMIAPIYGGRSDIEVLAIILGGSLEGADGYVLVRETWKSMIGGGDFERRWRRALHDGVLADAPRAGAPRGGVRFDEVARAAAGMTLPAAPTAQSLEVVFHDSLMGDGRFANNAWLQELPETATRMVWDNAALVSPATARALGLMPQPETTKYAGGAMAELSVGGRTLAIAVWVVPGMADNTVVLPLGYGRSVVGRVGEGTGFNTYALRTTQGLGMAAGATLKAASSGARWYPISTTQTHGSMEGRALIRGMDLAAWRKHGGEPSVREKDAYGREKELTLAERLAGSEMTHMPANVSIYKNPFTNSREAPAEGSAYTRGPQWGMSIDLSTCTGCGVCTIACSAENNIPVVGKIEVAKGREMTWIRVDRYFGGVDEDHVEALAFQPVPCQHCENAPCETVCPVNATVHGPEGINYMAYNRCIGTRYCANNCPYKVRRFNFFDYGPAQFNGEYLGKSRLGGVVQNPNLVPPRLRERMSEIRRMGQNPDVTIRSRGVMEKCSYCIQRINEARIEAKLSDLKGIPDGMVQAACQQACPSESIVFGDILDTTSNDGKGSKVRQAREHQRTYMLLGYLNTRPRTTYMAAVKNPNPRLRRPVEDPFEHHGEGHHGGGHGEGGHDGHGAHGNLLNGTPDRGLKVRLNVLGGIA